MSTYKVQYRTVYCDCGFTIGVPDDKREWRLSHGRFGNPIADLVHVLQQRNYGQWISRFVQLNDEDGAVSFPPRWQRLDDMLVSEHDGQLLGWTKPGAQLGPGWRVDAT